MALVVKDRVKVTTATTGTGTLTLGSAVAGFQAFSAVLSNADTTYYAIFESSTGAFEVGLGTYASPANTLARTTVLESSNAGSAINLTAGDADVFVTQPAEKAVYLDANGYIFTSDGRNLTNLNATNLTSGTVNDARLPATISSDITGNAATATAWATGRTLSLTGDVTGTSAAFDGSGNITLSTTIAANSVALGTDTTGNYVATGAVSGSGLSGSASAEGATFTVTSNATNANTPSTIVFRDASGNFSAGTITANLSGNATTATTATTANGVAANSVALGTDTTGNYVATIATNAGLDGSGSSEGAAVTLSLNLSELTTSTSDGDGDFFVVVDAANAQKKLTKGNINISGFNNDAGYTTNVGDITGVTAGSFITGGGTSGTVTINVDATSANTASKVVARDGSGNFSAGTITAALTGNAATATKWATGRTISLTGDVTGTSGAFDGSGNLSFATTIAANSVALGTDTTGNYVATGATSGNGLSGSVSSEGGTFTVTSNATNANTASTIVFRDASGNFSAGTITANLTGTASSATNADTVDSLHASQFLRSDAADSTASTISFTGDIEVGDQIFHHGDTDTYMQFHAANEWRVVTGGTEMFEVNDTNIIASANLDINADINGVNNIYLSGTLYHEGDTDTYLSFGTNTIALRTGGTDRLNISDSDFTVNSAVKEDYDALSGTTPTIDVDAGGGFSLTTSGNTTFTFSSFTSGVSCGFVLELTAGGTHTITWPASVDWAGGTAPDAPASGETDIYVFWSRDGGTTWYGVLTIDAAA
jgi:hypothetical protein